MSGGGDDHLERREDADELCELARLVAATFNDARECERWMDALVLAVAKAMKDKQ